MIEKAISCYKMTGSGNDFILIDNREGIVSESNLPEWIKKVCTRKLSVGADGLILIENSPTADFRWQFYNSDGSRAEMCGNGARCAARFANLIGMTGSEPAFETDAGLILARIDGERVRIRVSDPKDLRVDWKVDLEGGQRILSSVNTGVPHAVIFSEDLDAEPVKEIGREIRFHRSFAPAGTNVNFLQPIQPGHFAIRTYERGVEDETLACGTGSVAGAIVSHAKNLGTASPVHLHPRGGGVLTIHFDTVDGAYADVYLEGDARVIYRGEISSEAWRYDAPL